MMKNDEPAPRRPTARDLARVAGVSPATVDRVLHGRLPVREATARRVQEAARSIGYYFTPIIEQRVEASVRRRRLAFILQRRDSRFYQGVAQRIEETARRFGRSLAVDFVHVPPQEPASIAEAVRRCAARADAIALVAPDHPLVEKAVEETMAEGVPLLTLFSDCAIGARRAYIGIDNRKAGRSAAWLVSVTAPAPGPVAVLVGSHRYRGHEAREIGFRTFMREEAVGFQVIDTLFNLEDPAIAYEATREILRRHPDLAGLYVAGGGFEGVIAALRESVAPGRVSVICSEFTDLSQLALSERHVTAIVGTPIDTLATALIEAMLDGIARPEERGRSEMHLPIQFYLQESI